MATQAEADLALQSHSQQLFEKNFNLVKLSVVAERGKDGKATGDYVLGPV